MQKLTAHDPETKSPDLVADNISRLTALFPELVTEGPNGVAVNLDVLKQLVGDKAVTDAEEKYGLNWHGKRRARQLALTPSTGTLRPCPEDSVDWNTTQNLMIEGDNLEVLKLLQKSYAGKVKLIYIDPPYNTGKDFVYPDNFQDNIKNYLELTGQTGEGGKKLSSNTEASGRFHTDWLNMMYPRLKMARNLLREDGLIFISIDDSEVGNLREILDEIFGSENFAANFLWKKKGTTSNVEGADVSSQVDNTLCYRKGEKAKIKQRIRLATSRTYPLRDPEGNYRTTVIEKKNEGTYERETMLFEIIGHRPREGKRWQIGEDTARQLETKNRFIWDGEKVLLKIYDFEDADTRSAQPNLLDEHGSTEAGTSVLKTLFEGVCPFDNPKPVELLTHIIDIAIDEASIVMDFFAGSGTTAHSALIQNIKAQEASRYILIQLPEPLDPQNKDQKTASDFCDSLGKPRTIAELTKERLRRAGKKIREENPLFAGDLGFRVFKLNSTNIREWDPNRENLAESLEASVEHLKTDRTEQDILFELLLKLGLDLCVPMETKNIAGHEVHSIGAGTLLACLSKSIPQADVEPLAEGIVAWHKEQAPAGESTVVFRDSAFEDDVAKTNLAAILKQNGLETVRSL
jgi:adenine-specific DNA-methyltransferase